MWVEARPMDETHDARVARVASEIADALALDSRKLSERVAEVIAGRYPEVRTDLPRASTDYHGTVMTFTASAPEAARLTLYVNFDLSFSLHVGRFVIVEDEATSGTEAQQAAQILTHVEAIAINGVARSWLDRLLGLGRDRVGPWTAPVQSAG